MKFSKILRFFNWSTTTFFGKNSISLTEAVGFSSNVIESAWPEFNRSKNAHTKNNDSIVLTTKQEKELMLSITTADFKRLLMMEIVKISICRLLFDKCWSCILNMFNFFLVKTMGFDYFQSISLIERKRNDVRTNTDMCVYA